MLLNMLDSHYDMNPLGFVSAYMNSDVLFIDVTMHRTIQ